MARTKRGSAVLETARQRLAGLKSITPKPNFGPSLDLDSYEQEARGLETDLGRYNDTLSLLDRMQNDFEAREVRLRELNRRMLAATEAHYGPDSNEYMSAGGTPTSHRKAPTPRKKTADGDA
ncbi:MAG TPA: hypothetical protein VF668_10570 [Pyrinomonadaceae bacterium]|jgi:hypothetical protein